MPNAPQTARLPDGAESPQDASGTSSEEPNDSRQAERLSYFEIIDVMKSAKATRSNDPHFLIVVEDCKVETAEHLSATAGRLFIPIAGVDIPPEYP